ncbi:MAG: NAD-binding protein [Chloroflexota bacterium]
MSDLGRFVRVALVMACICALGTVGYVLVEGWPWFDAFYMTIITLAGVGYGEVRPLTQAGRTFTIVLITFGVGGAAYCVTTIMQFIVAGQIGRAWEQRRMQRTVEQLNNHFLLCGFGRVGRQVALDFAQAGTPFVIIDVNPSSLDLALESGYLCVRGDATSDDTLRRAGIERARGLVTCVANDADNIFVTLSARALRADLLIVARGNNDDAAPKLMRAGANRVVSPYGIGGRQMAMLAVRPSTVEFVDTVLHGAGMDLLVEDVTVSWQSPLVGRHVGEVYAEVAPGVVVMAVRRDGQLIAQPTPDTAIKHGDLLVVMGTAEQLRVLESAL